MLGHTEGYTPLMVALHRGRLECARALLRAGADPNYINGTGDLTLFWAIDGGVECMKLLAECDSCARATASCCCATKCISCLLTPSP